MTGSYNISNRSLEIHGDDARSNIALSEDDSFLYVSMNDTSYKIDQSEFDSISISSGGGDDSVRIYGDITVDSISTAGGNDSVAIFGGGHIKNLDTGSGSDMVNNMAGKIDNLNTGDGDDSISNNTLFSCAGEMKGTEITSVNTGAGNDYIVNAGIMQNVELGDGDDQFHNVTEAAVSNSVNGGDGADEITNMGRMQNLNTGFGNDRVYNNGGFMDFLNTGAGDDLLRNLGSIFSASMGDGDDQFYQYLFGRTDSLYMGKGNYQIFNYGVIKNAFTEAGNALALSLRHVTKSES